MPERVADVGEGDEGAALGIAEGEEVVLFRLEGVGCGVR